MAATPDQFDVDTLLTTTRSLRRRLDVAGDVALDDVLASLEIATHAPNASNRQIWRWLVIVDPDTRTAVGDLYRASYREYVESVAGPAPEGTTRPSDWLPDHMSRMPALVLPCVPTPPPAPPGDELFARSNLYGSVFPAVWNLQLALRTRGLGSCLTTLHLRRAAEIAALLHIPDDYTQICMVPVAPIRGANSFKPAPRRPIDEVVSIDSW
jgi:nitroreductase